MNELQRIDEQKKSSLPAAPRSLGLSLAYGAGVAGSSTLVLDLMSRGQVGASLAVGSLLGVTSFYFSGDIHRVAGPGFKALASVIEYINRNNSGRTKYRLLSKEWWMGLDTTVYAPAEDDEQEEQLPEPDNHQAIDGLPPVSAIPPQFKLGTVLDAVKEVNQQGYVYFGGTCDRQVLIHIDDMYHVWDVASSGKGKTNRFRLALMQVVGMADTYFINPFANEVKAVKDARKIEVWKPIFDRLANGHPVKEGQDILDLMTFLVEEIKRRIQQEARRDFSWRERPIFVFIDELPEVYARCPQAIELLDEIGRTGRQFCVFSWVASQTAAVKETGQSTAAQGNYKTRIYGGGDRNSSSRMMKGSIAMEDEQTLQTNGAGLTLMLAEGFSKNEFVRAPLVTNEALFAYFGLPAFKLEEWLAPVVTVSRQPVQRLDETFTVPFTPPLSRDEKEPSQARNVSVFPRERSVKVQRESPRERVRESLNEDQIDAVMEAVETLDFEKKALTMNAIAKATGLNWRHYDDIEDVVTRAGYSIELGKGRPAKAESGS